MKLLSAAEAYATTRSWPVFPCGRDKKPLVRNGFKDATIDVPQIREWWKQHPDAAIGIATGSASGIFAVDLDVDQSAHKDGIRSLAEYAASGEYRLTPTYTVTTPRGGRHLYYGFPKDSQVRSRIGMLPGVDVKGDGGYVIAAPSEGERGKYVSWPCADVAPAPEWLLTMIAGDVTQRTQSIQRIHEINHCSAIPNLPVEEAITRTLPTYRGQRHKAVFKLVRALRFECDFPVETPLGELRPIVQEWHRRARDTIGTKEFTETWGDFVDGWKRARTGLDGAVIPNAVQSATREQPIFTPEWYDSQQVCQFFAICWHLARRGGGSFYLSMHTPAILRALDVKPMTVCRYLKMFVADEFLKVEKKGNIHDGATVYRWCKPEQLQLGKGVAERNTPCPAPR